MAKANTNNPAAQGITWSATVFSAGVLYKTAVEAYQRLSEAESDTAHGKNDALISIMFAVATLEAIINEFAAAAAFDAEHGHSCLAPAAAIISEAESSQGSVRLKFDVAKFAISGTTYEKGKRPYQDFRALLSIRNEIVHLKEPKADYRPDNLARYLQSQGLVELPKEGAISVLTAVGTRGVARWACNVVPDMIATLTQHLPADEQGKPAVSTRVVLSRFDRVT
jgi:hypothetical protein